MSDNPYTSIEIKGMSKNFESFPLYLYKESTQSINTEFLTSIPNTITKEVGSLDLENHLRQGYNQKYSVLCKRYTVLRNRFPSSVGVASMK